LEARTSSAGERLRRENGQVIRVLPLASSELCGMVWEFCISPWHLALR
jgi:hypothetical protein